MRAAGWGLSITARRGFDAEAKVREYAAALMAAAEKVGGLTLLLEPGRFLVAQAGALLARVLYVKKNGTKTFVITDAGMNDLIRPALYQAYHEIVPVAARRAEEDDGGGCGGSGVRDGRFFCARPGDGAGEAGRSGGAAGCGGVRDVAGVELQFAAAGGGGVGGGTAGAADPAAGNDGGSGGSGARSYGTLIVW